MLYCFGVGMLRSSGWVEPASSSGSQAPGCEGWRWLCRRRLCRRRRCAGPGDTCSADRVLGAAERGPGIRVDAVPHVGGGQLSVAGSPLHDDHHTSAAAAGSRPTVLW